MKKVFIFFLSLVLFFIISAPKEVSAQCAVPSQVPNVNITFPNCTGDECNYTQGKCSWGTVSGATSFKVTVTAVETGTVVLDQSVATSEASIAFPVASSATYKCQVSAINSCGTGVAGESTLLCKVDIFTSPTQTPTYIPTKAPVPTIVPTGTNTLILSGIGIFGFLILGLSLLFL